LDASPDDVEGAIEFARQRREFGATYCASPAGARTVEIQTADAIRLYGGNAVWKDVAQTLLDNTCQQRTDRHEEDGCWPALDTP
jgi:hypothetical protein